MRLRFFVQRTGVKAMAWQSPAPRPSRADAFTLIELLVVISVIALLVAILLPTLASSRINGQRAVSLSQSRQIMLAMHMYANDNFGSLPFSRYEDYEPTTSNVPYWGAVLVVRDKYLATPTVLWSPARDPWYLASISTLQTNPNSPNYNRTGFTVNQNAMCPRSVTSGRRMPLRLGMTGQPNNSQMICLVEGWDEAAYSGALRQDGLNVVLPGTSVTSARLFTYRNTVTTSYVDGHGVAVEGRSIGWDPGAGNGRDGKWIYTSTTQFRYVTPWFDQWYSAP